MKNETTDNYDGLLTEVEKMIYKCAWKAAERYNLNFDEALSECYWDFVRATALGRYKPARNVKFSTYLQNLIQWHFLTLARKRMLYGQQYPSVELNEEVAGAAPAAHSPALDAVEGLSSEAREIVGLLVETPGELLNVWDPCTPKELLRRVKAYLQRKGHSRKRLDEAHAEIEQTFRAIWAGQEVTV